jgi:hypothetical protein
VDFKSGLISGGGPNTAATPGQNQLLAEPNGNTTSGNAYPLAQLKFSKPLDPRLNINAVFGVLDSYTTDTPSIQTQFGLQYKFTKNLSGEIDTGVNNSGQNETSLNFKLSQPLPEIFHAKEGDKDRPNFLQFDAIPSSYGKFHITWETDKVTKGEVKIIDDNESVVKDVVEKEQPAYDHQMDIDKLNPEQAYKVQVTATDLNRNQAVSILKIAPQVTE